MREITFPARTLEEAILLESRWTKRAEVLGLVRPLLVGEMPSRGREGWPALHGGRAMERLAKIVDVPLEHLLRMTQRVNLFDDRTRWSVPAARSAAWFIVDNLILPVGSVIAIGERVHVAVISVIGGSETPYFVVDDHGWTSYAHIPHPSGRCRTWNSCVVRQQAKEFFHELLAPYAVLTKEGTHV